MNSLAKGQERAADPISKIELCDISPWNEQSQDLQVRHFTRRQWCNEWWSFTLFFRGKQPFCATKCEKCQVATRNIPEHLDESATPGKTIRLPPGSEEIFEAPKDFTCGVCGGRPHFMARNLTQMAINLRCFSRNSFRHTQNHKISDIYIYITDIDR